MSFLLDTVVLSELRRRRRNPRVTAWLSKRATSELFLSVVTLGEIERGIAARRRGDPVFAEELAAWLEQVIALYAEQILPVDIRVARRWGQLSQQLGHSGADLLLAATALEHGLTVVTRNLRHFLPTGVTAIDPFTQRG